MMAVRRKSHKTSRPRASPRKIKFNQPPPKIKRSVVKVKRKAKATRKSSLFWKLFNQQKKQGGNAEALMQMQPRQRAARSVIRSQLDELLELVNEKGRVTLAEISSKFKIDHALAESWAKILEEAGLAELHYPAVGEADLVKAGYDEEQKKAAEKKKEAAKARPFFNFSFGRPSKGKTEAQAKRSPAAPSRKAASEKPAVQTVHKKIAVKKQNKPWFASSSKRRKQKWQWKF